MAARDVRDLARLHRKAFPDFFLKTLGEPFLVQFYGGFLQDETAISVVARDEDGMRLGAIVGSTEPSGFFGRLVKHHRPGFALASAPPLLHNPTAASRLMRAVRYRGEAPAGEGGALLSSICVDPAAQGGGIGRLLIDEWTRVAATKGAHEAFLTTDAIGNDVVNGFYQARGWMLTDTHQTRKGRSMNRYMKRLDTF
jgi:ribosomal protein S18 acetylase RimI-like enzyme